MEARQTRRAFLMRAATVTLATFVAGCAPKAAEGTVVEKEKVVKETVIVEGTPKVVEKVVTATPAPLKGEMTFQAGGYYPSESMEWSETNPNPHNMILTIVDEYQQLHPEVEVELVQRPPAYVSDREWIVSNMAAGTEPDIVWELPTRVVEDLAKGWWIVLDPYLDMPNPYVEAGKPGSKAWIELFFDAPYEATRQLGRHYEIAFDIVTSMMFYNKDIFAKVGVQPPETLAELLKVFQKLKDAGYIAYGGIGSWYMYETLGQMAGSLMAHLTPKVNPKGGIPGLDTIACAISKGVYRYETPEGREWLRLMQQVAAYRTPDWSDKKSDAITKWLHGDIVVVEDGTWRIGQNKKNPNLEFNWGTFNPPKVTKESSPLATGAPCVPAATCDCCGVTKGALRDKNLALCVDWLMFFTAPQNAERMINELGTSLPAMKGATPADPDLVAIIGALQDTALVEEMWTYYDRTDLESRLEIWDLKNAFLLNQLTLEQCAAKSDELLVKYAEKFIKEHQVKCDELGFV